jgi:reactive chlorine resistance protein C
MKPLLPKLYVLGSVVAIGLFLATITFLFTTPAWVKAPGRASGCSIRSA